MKTTQLLLTLFFGLGIFATLPAQSLSVKPGLVRMENDKLAMGMEFRGDYTREYTITSESSFPRLLQFDAGVSGSFLTDPVFNPKNQHADIYLGYLISFKKAQEIRLGAEPEPGIDYGSISLGLNAVYEANQTFTEQNLDQGAELRYVNSSQSFLPVLESSYLISIPLQSKFRKELNQETNVYRRFEVRAFWAVSVGRILLNPDFRYFKSSGLSSELDEAGLDKGLRSSLTVGYLFDKRETGFFQFFDYIYLQYNRGQVPVYLGNRETIEVGVTFRF